MFWVSQRDPRCLLERLEFGNTDATNLYVCFNEAMHIQYNWEIMALKDIVSNKKNNTSSFFFPFKVATAQKH